MSGISWKTDVGVNHVGAYQVSGRPFAKARLTAPASGSTPLKVEFPKVARWFQIIPHNDNASKIDLRVGFSEYGATSGSAYFRIHARNTDTYHPRFELKVSELHFMSDNTSTVSFDIVAGLTNISTDKLNTSLGTNWSGSSGVG